VAAAPPQQIIVKVPQPLPLPGQLRPRPESEKAKKAPKSGTDIVDEANRSATAAPDDQAFYNAITTYDYAPGALFVVYAAPLRVTSLQLEPGERLRGNTPIALGDPLRWKVGTMVSGDNARGQQIVLIKPIKAGLTTTAVITTDRRTYFLDLTSYEATYMVAVQWRYADTELEQMTAMLSKDEAASRSTVSTRVNVDGLDFGYAVKVENGKPQWTPTQVFDDGHKTFIRFPPAMLERESPALFALSAQREIQLVNYRPEGTWYVVDGLFDQAELRAGQKDQNIVRIAKVRR